MRLRHPPAQVQPEPDPASIATARRIRPMKGLPQPLDLGGVDARAVVAHHQAHLPGAGGRAELHRGIRHGGAAMPAGVVQQVAHQQLDAGRMGTTLTAAYLLGNMLYLAHVGDSRAYLIREGRSICLTSDHTTVGEMVRSKLISADKIRTHAQRSILTKSIGTSLFVQPDIIQQKLQAGDRVILCSDGLWSVIEDEEFAQVTNEASTVEEAAKNLVELALDHDTDDNASVVAVHLHKLIPIPQQESNDDESAGWFQKLRKFVS